LWEVGSALRLHPGLPTSLPATARDGLPSWAGEMNVDATCVASYDVDDLLVVVYRVQTRPPR
jgi:hypothetical protein